MLGKNLFEYYAKIEKIDPTYITNLLLKDFEYRYNSQLNILAEIYGSQGSGKSLAGQDLAYRTGKIFGLDFVMDSNTVADFDILDSLLHNSPYRSTFVVDEQPTSMFGYGSSRVMRGLKDYEEICRYCLLHNTKIYIIDNNKLKTKKVSDLDGKTFTVLSKNLKNGKVEQDQAYCKFNSIDFITKITLRNGKTIEANDEHPFFIKTKDGLKKKRVEDLEVGDDLFCKKGVFKAQLNKHTIKTKKKESKIFKKRWKDGAYKNRIVTPETRKNMAKIMVKNYKTALKNGTYNKKRWTKKRRKERSELSKRLWEEKGEQTAKKISKSLKGFKWTKKRNLHIKWLWKQEWYIKKQMIARNIVPNKSETKLAKIILSFGYKFVGDGTVLILKKSPDFINKKEKKIIELFGEPFHTKEEAKSRIALFKKQGFKTLIIWSMELQNKKKLQKKLVKFYEN